MSSVFAVSVIGCPRSGVSTHASKIADFGDIVLPILNTSSILDSCLHSDFEIGERVRDWLLTLSPPLDEVPEYPDPPDELLHSAVHATLSCQECSDGWVMENYPRKPSDVLHLKEIGELPVAAIMLTVRDSDELSRRLAVNGPEEAALLLRKVSEFKRGKLQLETSLSRNDVPVLSFDASQDEGAVVDSVDRELQAFGFGISDSEEDWEEESESDSESEGEEGEEGEELEEGNCAIVRIVPVVGGPLVSGSPLEMSLSKRYEYDSFVGQGSSGTFVVKARDVLLGDDVAIKVIRRTSTFSDLKKTVREILVLNHFSKHLGRSGAVASLQDVIPTAPSPDQLIDINVVMSWGGRNFYSLLHGSQKRGFSQTEVRRIMYDLFCGLRIFHSAGILHRDIRPRNMCYIPKTGQVMIIDYGGSRGVDCDAKPSNLDRSRVNRLMSVVESGGKQAFYRSPELLLQAIVYSESSDVWSLGVIFAEMMMLPATRRRFFEDHERPETASDYRKAVSQLRAISRVLGSPKRRDLHGKPPWIRDALRDIDSSLPRRNLTELLPRAGADAIDLLGKILLFNPSDRISVADALAHPFFEEIRDVARERVCRKFVFRIDQVRKAMDARLSPRVLREYLFRVVKNFGEKKHRYVRPPRFL